MPIRRNVPSSSKLVHHDGPWIGASPSKQVLSPILQTSPVKARGNSHEALPYLACMWVLLTRTRKVPGQSRAKVAPSAPMRKLSSISSERSNTHMTKCRKEAGRYMLPWTPHLIGGYTIACLVPTELNSKLIHIFSLLLALAYRLSYALERSSPTYMHDLWRYDRVSLIRQVGTRDLPKSPLCMGKRRHGDSYTIMACLPGSNWS